jgi:hypothetical protein
MPRAGHHQVQAETARRTKEPLTLKASIDAQYRANPGLRRRVNALLKKMLREQAAARLKATKRQQNRRTRKARPR